ncbi:hypothetical protein D3C87_973700 [compost metagenome]
MKQDLTLRMHWHIPLRRDWPKHRQAANLDIPIVEKTSGLLVCLVAHRRSQPYTLARARAIVRANNNAVNAARKESREEKNS